MYISAIICNWPKYILIYKYRICVVDIMKMRRWKNRPHEQAAHIYEKNCPQGGKM